MANQFLQPNKIRTRLPAVTKPKRPAAPAKPAAQPPTLEQQATTTVQGQLQPILDQINAAAQQRLQAGQQAITGYTSSLAQQLAGIPYGAPYQGAQEKQAAVDSALQQALAGGGTQLAGDLSKRLAMIHDPSVAAAAGQVAQQGAAAGNTQLAQGGAALGALIANEAAAKNYGQKLPGIAGLAGLQDIRGLAGQVNADTGKQVADVQGQAPGLINSALGRLQSQQQATAKAQLDARKPNPTLSAAAGVLVNDYGEAITGKGGKPVPYTPYSKPGSVSAGKTFGSAKSGYFLLTPDGKVKQVVAPVAATAGGTGGRSTHLQAKTINGHAVTFDPVTGTFYQPGTQIPVDPNTLTKPAKPVKVSAAAMGKARTYLYQQSHGYFATQTDPETPLTPSQVTAAKNAGETVGRVTVAQNQDAEIQNIYLTLVQKYGIPARQAFNMVASQYKAWGNARRAAYFPGKADAAQGAAYQPTAYTTSRISQAQLPQLAQAALQIAAPRYANDQNVQALVGRIMQESGGNPLAINNWDSNAKAGHPSKGILQTIPSTFQTYALPGHGDIWNPLDNAIAAIRYMLARYGHIVGPSSTGY